MKIEITKAPNPADVAFLRQKINEETPEYGAPCSYACYIRDEKGEIVAGVNGFLGYGTISLGQLWVDKQHRKAGLGRQLLEQVHALGRAEGCKLSTVGTMTFQGAVGFYEKLGYTKDFERSGYLNGSSCLFMRKDL
jgi:GNAT superfamily N-acetyltransferase